MTEILERIGVRRTSEPSISGLSRAEKFELDRKMRLRALLLEAKAEHSKVVCDGDWAGWYAEYMLDRLP